MTLQLDHNQRLNLVYILGTYDTKGREMHALWHLMDTIDLNGEEKQTIGLREDIVNGQKVQYWEQGKTLPARTYDLPDADLERIRKALDDFPQMRASRDRSWLEPLLAQMPNGAK